MSLPKVYQNKLNNIDSNSLDYTYCKKSLERNINIQDKINELFNSNDYIYKLNLIITTKEGEYKKTIIGKNSKYLISIDNELIPIESIIDIKK